MPKKYNIDDYLSDDEVPDYRTQKANNYSCRIEWGKKVFHTLLEFLLINI